MLISVIVPIYNSEKHLEKCLQSIALQTYREIEVICILDGVTDDSKDIVLGIKSSDNRFVVIENSENFGLVRSRKVGVEAAKGSIICFVDSDDWVGENFVQDIVDDFCDDVDCVVYGHNEVRDDVICSVSPAFLGEFFVQDFLTDGLTFCYNYDFTVFGLTTFLWNKGFRKEKFESVLNRVDDGVTIGEDFLFLLNYLRVSFKLKSIDKFNYFYVQHSESMVKSRSLGTFERLEILRNQVQSVDLKIFNLPSVQRYLDSVYFIRMFCPRGLLEHKFNSLVYVLHNSTFLLVGFGTFRNHVDSYVRERNLKVYCGEDIENVVYVICHIEGNQRKLEEQKCRNRGRKFWSIAEND